MSESFFNAVETRRTYYGLTPKSTLSDEEIKALVERSVKHAPTSFNMQQSRAVVLTGKKNEVFWDLIMQVALEAANGDETQIQSAKSRIPGFKAGYGTVVFFEDKAVVEQWGQNMPNYAECFRIWSGHATGILQYIVWTAFATAGMGASLQHYATFTPGLEKKIQELLEVPETWTVPAMMPFGIAEGGPGNPAHPKTFQDVEERVKVYFD